MDDSRRAVSIALFVTFGLVGAFLVSVVAARVGPDARGGAHGPDALDTPAARDAAPVAPRTPAERGLIRVEVLNGAGTTGLARDATHRLRGAGFDVVFFGNAGAFGRPASVVLDRTGDPTRARDVAAVLGIGSVATVIDSTLLLDVTVVLGRDWPPASAAPAPLTDRIRRLLPGSDTTP